MWQLSTVFIMHGVKKQSVIHQLLENFWILTLLEPFICLTKSNFPNYEKNAYWALWLQSYTEHSYCGDNLFFSWVEMQMCQLGFPTFRLQLIWGAVTRPRLRSQGPVCSQFKSKSLSKKLQVPFHLGFHQLCNRRSALTAGNQGSKD